MSNEVVEHPVGKDAVINPHRDPARLTSSYPKFCKNPTCCNLIFRSSTSEICTDCYMRTAAAREANEKK